MTSWRPKLSTFHFALLILPVLFLLFAVWLWGKLVERTLSVEYDAGAFFLGLALFLSLVAAVMSVYLAWCAFTLRYVVHQSHLSILYGGVAQFIPLGAITDV